MLPLHQRRIILSVTQDSNLDTLEYQSSALTSYASDRNKNIPKYAWHDCHQPLFINVRKET